jgi:hypothetical protein
MDLTAREATILTLLSAHPLTRFFDRLVEKLENPNVKALAQKIREHAAETQMAESERLTAQR